MNILVVHNVYQQRAGEEAVVEAEATLLKTNGHTVVRYERSNEELLERGKLGRIGAAIETVWSSRSFRETARLIKETRPDVAHFHNTFPVISPSAYHACAQAGVPVVQTLHNYRLLCPAAKFLRDGKLCEDCLGRNTAWPAVLHGCYRGSRSATAAAAAMLAAHRWMGSWRTKVDVYVALSEFARRKFIEGGLPADRVVVKPNFVFAEAPPRTQPGDYVLAVGRISEEKGPQLLLSAWRGMHTKIPLRVAGDGPLLEKLAQEVKAGSLDSIELLGRRIPDEVRALMRGARFLVFPSIWYEGFPMTIVEAFAGGIPVVTSQLGSMSEIVQAGVTGLHFQPGSPVDLAAKVEWAWLHPEEMRQMGENARAEYVAKYRPSANYRMLMDVYRGAMARRARQSTIRQPRLRPGQVD
jgi:glycosyltransferase involved in cell wall biosynthesis